MKKAMVFGLGTVRVVFVILLVSASAFAMGEERFVVGDWNGDGIDTPGIFRDGEWFLRNENSGGIAQINLEFGNPGDIPFAGDWNGDGTDSIGVFRPSSAH